MMSLTVVCLSVLCAQLSLQLSVLTQQNSELKEQATDKEKLVEARQEIQELHRHLELQQQESQSRAEAQDRAHTSLQGEKKRECTDMFWADRCQLTSCQSHSVPSDLEERVATLSAELTSARAAQAVSIGMSRACFQNSRIML